MCAKLIFSFILTAELFILCSSTGDLDRCIQHCEHQRLQVHQGGSVNISVTNHQNTTYTDCKNKCILNSNIQHQGSKKLKKPTYSAKPERVYKYHGFAEKLDKNKFESRIHRPQEQHPVVHKLHPEMKNFTQFKNQSNKLLVAQSIGDYNIKKMHPANLTGSNLTAINKTKSPTHAYENNAYEKSKVTMRMNPPGTLSMGLSKPSFTHDDKFISKEDFNHYIRAIFGKYLGEKLVDFLNTLADKN